MGYTREEILQDAKNKNVRFVHMQFTDVFGTLKNVAITVEQLPKALDGEIMFDGSSIEGFVRIEESDMYLRPDYDTYAVFPFDEHPGGATARLICDVYNSDNSEFEGCPRTILKRVTAEAAELGYMMNVGPELEFFLFLRDENNDATTVTHDQGGYFDLSPLDRGEIARQDMVVALEKMGFEIEAAHHEVAPAQHEIDFKYADALKTADNIATFKFVTRKIALAHGLHATFMPKPIYGISGSGMHTNQSLFRGEENAFFDPDAKYQLSEDALHYMGGLLQHAQAMALITNPLINSYKRLVPGYEAPINIAWSERNRSPLIRVPAKRGLSTRIELRNPDPAANPYLTLAANLKVGLVGIREKLNPGAPIVSNIYNMTSSEKRERNIKALPRNLGEAIAFFEKSKMMKEALGDHAYFHYLEAKKQEWYLYCEQVHQWELDHYLRLY